MNRINHSSGNLFMSSLLMVVACLAVGGPAGAHPMGNFSINHYARFEAQAKD